MEEVRWVRRWGGDRCGTENEDPPTESGGKKQTLRCNSRFTRLASHEIASLCRITRTVLTIAGLVCTIRVSVLVLHF